MTFWHFPSKQIWILLKLMQAKMRNLIREDNKLNVDWFMRFDTEGLRRIRTQFELAIFAPSARMQKPECNRRTSPLNIASGAADRRLRTEA
jgi:hypothetical protein